ncbi:MAG: histidine kinase dimerization/phospho-acceptor domain-containing protein, partial [Christensenellales bacterium]
MKKHLFISVLLSSLLLSGIAVAVLLIAPLTPDTQFMRVWLPCIVLLLSALIPAAIVSRFSGEIISRRINSIDPKSPESRPTYRELSPLITKMKNQGGRVAARLRELGLKKAELDEAISHMQEGILIVNHRGDILSHNDRALEILGANTERSYRSVLSLPEDQALRELLARALGGTRCESERNADGRFYRMLGSPIKTDAGITGAIILMLDETEKEHREALRREFTANISHELKTPLTSI